MPTATITAKYVNPPKEGKKKGSVKTADDQMFGVWADKISHFQVGGIYDIEYTEETGQDGKVWKTIKTATKKGESRPTFGGGGARNSYRETSAKDAERMFVCSILNAAIAAGKVEFSGEKLRFAVNGLRSVWADTFAADEVKPT